MTEELFIMTTTAITIAFIHTLFGPDHYLPFIAMGKARKWSVGKTAGITFLCGTGHVAGSLLLGSIGIALGLAVTTLEVVETLRGDIAAWGLITFGSAYFAWGLKRALKNRPHTHGHNHGDGLVHRHEHVHKDDHTHLHESPDSARLTPWLLFVIFVLGPCEPLIPLLMYPAAVSGLYEVIIVSAVFGAVTILTMVGVVVAMSLGMRGIKMGGLHQYSHSLAGATLCGAGLAIQFFGL